MISISQERLDHLFNNFNRQKIIVIGDLMLDRYIWGKVNKISPEAPVPVIEVEDESIRFGGAANVAYNVYTLGADVVPVGIIGRDDSGEKLKELFKENELSIKGLIQDSERPTTIKTRIIAHNQHVARIDREMVDGISDKIQKSILNIVEAEFRNASGVILEDYNKGLFVQPLIENIIELARKNDKPVLVDPKFNHFEDFRHVTLFKPNKKEVNDKLGMRIENDIHLEEAGKILLDKLDCESVLITLGNEGMALFEKGKPWSKVPTKAVTVHDVSGAGDTVISTLAVALSAGANMKEAATLANHAAGIVCSEVGIVPIQKNILMDEMLSEVE